MQDIPVAGMTVCKESKGTLRCGGGDELHERHLGYFTADELRKQSADCRISSPSNVAVRQTSLCTCLLAFLLWGPTWNLLELSYGFARHISLLSVLCSHDI